MWSHLWIGGTWWSGWDALWPNLLASAVLAVIAWFWKVKPHFQRQRERHERTLTNQTHIKALLLSLHEHHGIPAPELPEVSR